MSYNQSETSGTFPGDTANSFLQVSANINGATLNIEGQYSSPTGTNSAVVPFSSSLALPAANGTLTTYVSVQLTNTSGALTLYPSTAAAPTLQGTNLIEVFKTQIPAGATSDENDPGNAEPDLI